MANMLLVAYNERQKHQLRQALGAHRLTLAHSASESIQLMREHSYDAVVSALQKCSTDVFTLLSAVKSDKHLSEIPLILYCSEPSDTAPAIQDTVRAAIRVLGATHYVSMPKFDAETLKTEVEGCIQNSL